MPKVWINASLGKVRTIGSMIILKMAGMSRVNETARHSMYTPPSRSRNRQYEFSRQRKPYPVSEACTRSRGVTA